MPTAADSHFVTRLDLDANLTAALRSAARKRGMNAPELARALLETVLADNLVSAVMDTDHSPAIAPPKRGSGRSLK
jgi:hypothetical protein